MHEARDEHPKLLCREGPWKPPLAEEACDGTQAEGQAARGRCPSAHTKGTLARTRGMRHTGLWAQPALEAGSVSPSLMTVCLPPPTQPERGQAASRAD